VFTHAGGVAAKGLARWNKNTATWSKIGNGTGPRRESFPGTIYALAVAGNSLYVGGDFDTIDGVKAEGIARYNLSTNQWSPLGRGVGYSDDDTDPDYPLQRGIVRAITVAADGKVYVGGEFSHAGNANNVLVNSVAAWNPSSSQWSALGGGLLDDFDFPATAYALTVSGNTVYVGGDFTRAGGQNIGLIARWNAGASNWSGLGSGLSGGAGAAVKSITLSGGLVYAGGEFTTAGGASANSVARFDPGNAAWSTLSGGATYTYDDPGRVNALAANAQGVVFMGGDFDRAGTIQSYNAAAWYNEQWRAMGKGFESLETHGTIEAVAVAPDGKVYVGGSFDHVAGKPIRNAAIWDGVTWSGMGDVGDEFASVHAIAIHGNDVYFGGNFTQAGGIGANYIARWNTVAKSWSPLGNGVSGRVNALAIDVDGSLIAGGDFETAGSAAVDNVARWNPTSGVWSPLSAKLDLGDLADNEVFALAIDSGGVWIGGQFEELWAQGWVEVNSLLYWERSADEMYYFPDGADGAGVMYNHGGYGTVRALALSADECELYIGGEFQRVVAVAASGIAGFSFCPDFTVFPMNTGVTGGSGAYPQVRAIAVRGNDVFVAGNFTATGAGTTSMIGRWDRGANQWNAMGSGLGSPGDFHPAYALAVSPSKVFVGGYFATAGGRPASSFAVWDADALPPNVTPRVAIPAIFGVD
jgi:hypothetical protein